MLITHEIKAVETTAIYSILYQFSSYTAVNSCRGPVKKVIYS